MEKRLIDADELYKKLEGKYKYANGGPSRFAYKDAIDDVCNAPTIDPVKYGRWEHWVKDLYRCSICGYYTEYVYCNNFCPHCGARMDGGTP